MSSHALAPVRGSGANTARGPRRISRGEISLRFVASLDAYIYAESERHHQGPWN